MKDRNNSWDYKKNSLLKICKNKDQSDYYLNGGGDLPGPGGPQNCIEN